MSGGINPRSEKRCSTVVVAARMSGSGSPSSFLMSNDTTSPYARPSTFTSQKTGGS